MNNRFKILQQKVLASDVDDCRYHEIEPILSAIKAAANVSKSHYLIVDHVKRNFIFVDDKPFMTRIPKKTALELGFRFYSENVFDAEEFERLKEINYAIMSFMSNINSSEWKFYSACYCITFKNISGQPQIINHLHTPLLLSSSGKLWLSICAASQGYNRTKDVVEILKYPNLNRYQYQWANKDWKEMGPIQLTDFELFMLQHSAAGYSLDEIAAIMCRSESSIKHYRNCVVEKLGVSNTSEAITLARTYNLL